MPGVSTRILLGLTAILGVAGATIWLSGTARAESVALFGYPNFGTSSFAFGTHEVLVSVTPAAAGPGQPIEVQVTSPDWAVPQSTPVAVQPDNFEFDAVVAVGGVDYILRGPRNTATIPSGPIGPGSQTFLDAGWVISSTPGNSAATTTNSAGSSTASTGVGSTLRSDPLTPTPLVAPATPGLYNIVVKAFVLNWDGSQLGRTASITEDIDTVINREASNPPGALANNQPTSYITNTTLSVGTATMSIDAVLEQASGVTSSARPGNTLLLSGSGWETALGVGDFEVELCDTDGSGCSTVGDAALGTDSAGLMSGSVTVPAGATTGARLLTVTTVEDSTAVPFRVLGDPTLTASPASPRAGDVVAVSGTDFNPVTPVSVRGFSGASLVPVTYTADSESIVAPSASGSFSITMTFSDPATAVVGARQWDTGFQIGPPARTAQTPLTVTPRLVLETRNSQPFTTWGRNGDTLGVAGSGWPAGSPSAELCQLPGLTNCVQQDASGLVVDALGELSGDVPLAAGAFTGEALLVMSSGGKSDASTLQIVGSPTLSVVPASVTQGEELTVSGTGFTPDQAVFVRGFITETPAGALSADAIDVSTDATGSFSTSFRLDDVATRSVGATDTLPDTNPQAWTSVIVNAAPPPPPGPVALFGYPNFGTSSFAFGTHEVLVSVTPAAAGPGQPIEVQVTSPDWAVPQSTPVAVQPDNFEFDAVVAVGGVDYILRGPRNTATIPSGPIGPGSQTFLDAGWVISSTPGNSAATTTNSAGSSTASTGVGSTLRSDPLTPTPLVAPATPGLYNIVVKAFVLNWDGSQLGRTASITEDIDTVINREASNPPGALANNQPTSYITNTTLRVGAEAEILQSTGQEPGVQAIRKYVAGTIPAATSTTLTGTGWEPSSTPGSFQVDFCDVAGITCDTLTTPPTNGLFTDAAGELDGTIVLTTATSAQLTEGIRAIRVTRGPEVALIPVQILGTPTVTLSPAGGGTGTLVTVWGSNFNPLQPVNVAGGRNSTAPFAPFTTDAVGALGSTSASGAVQGQFRVLDTATRSIILVQGMDPTAWTPASGQPAGGASFALQLDRCIAYDDNSTAGQGCDTEQNVDVSITQGSLVQRVYTNATPTVGSDDGSGVTAPIAGTSNVNSSPTQVNLGTITSPLAPATIVGNMNDVTITDNRGGTFGWSLTASLTDFTGVGGSTMSKSQLSVTPTCAPASGATAWDYSSAGQVPIPGFDPTSSAAGTTAGATQSFANSVSLCTKDSSTNPVSQSSGGVYNVSGSLVLTVPSFQSADTYTAVLTITLA